jgi:hypothetical protein
MWSGLDSPANRFASFIIANACKGGKQEGVENLLAVKLFGFSTAYCRAFVVRNEMLELACLLSRGEKRRRENRQRDVLNIQVRAFIAPSYN